MSEIRTVRLRGVVTDGVTPPSEGERHDVSFSYDPKDPFAVSMHTLHTTWVFSRELLLDPDANVVVALPGKQVMMGDVIVLAGEGVTTVVLNPAMNEQSACVVVETLPLQAWLHLTLEVCPRGNEQVDVDAWISRILESAS